MVRTSDPEFSNMLFKFLPLGYVFITCSEVSADFLKPHRTNSTGPQMTVGSTRPMEEEDL